MSKFDADHEHQLEQQFGPSFAPCLSVIGWRFTYSAKGRSDWFACSIFRTSNGHRKTMKEGDYLPTLSMTLFEAVKPFAKSVISHDLCSSARYFNCLLRS